MPALSSTPARFPKAIFGAALAALLLLCLPACDSDGGENGEGVNLPEGTFEVAVSGDVTAELSGEAIYSSITEEDDPEPDEPDAVFQLFMTKGDNSPALLLTRPFVERPETSEVPAEGTYEIADVEEAESSGQPPPENTFGVLFYDTEGDRLFASRSGTLEITHRADDRLAGTFQLAASEISLIGSPPPNPGEVRIEGAFHATQTDELPE